jgi:hypothetical protein
LYPHNPIKNKKMGHKSTTYLKDTNKDFNNVLDSMYNTANVQRILATGAFTISDDTALVSLALDGAMTTTMPAATVGKSIRVIWEVEQASDNRIFTCAGSDTFAGNLNYLVEAAGDSTADSTAIANTIVAITFVDDVNIGSYVDFQCVSKGLWLTTGNLVIDSIGNVATLA